MNQACALMGVYPMIDRKEVLIDEKILLKAEGSGEPCVVMGHFYYRGEVDGPRFRTRIVPTKEYMNDLQFYAESQFESRDEMDYSAPRDAAQAAVQITQGVNPDFVFSIF